MTLKCHRYHWNSKQKVLGHTDARMDNVKTVCGGGGGEGVGITSINFQIHETNIDKKGS